ncbi:hypothetical protein CC85DRAFT_289479 [Cutaneotrichosporon oleaginosum]|uniref:Uncharacterized protein n=1 Tax=Cutaneotrichosporon oleaginosum TaxID=879819 RepID=A0A0J1AT41_9TREE|nr:uncharacterized protein CC85DRAFT_289479 [Cutaneotrichosporon oleaginosum]KLT38479.1 hypothetical protein CC85DRAFT_289479 [Cutaneotrichosporon oleaginosum]TXT12159.1 hypothetical protein COLE_02569 [Cutaneotrichosporon oleaginosum]
MKFLGLLALTLAAAAPIAPAPAPVLAPAPAADGIFYHPLPAWTPGHPELNPKPAYRHQIEVDGRVFAVSRPTWLASYLSSLLPQASDPESRVLAAQLPPDSGYSFHRTFMSDMRHAAARGYDALGDRRTYAAVMLVVAVLNFSSILLVLMFFRGRDRECDYEEGAAPEGKIKLEQ